MSDAALLYTKRSLHCSMPRHCRGTILPGRQGKAFKCLYFMRNGSGEPMHGVFVQSESLAALETELNVIKMQIDIVGGKVGVPCLPGSPCPLA